MFGASRIHWDSDWSIFIRFNVVINGTLMASIGLIRIMLVKSKFNHASAFVLTTKSILKQAINTFEWREIYLLKILAFLLPLSNLLEYFKWQLCSPFTKGVTRPIYYFNFLSNGGINVAISDPNLEVCPTYQIISWTPCRNWSWFWPSLWPLITTAI